MAVRARAEEVSSLASRHESHGEDGRDSMERAMAGRAGRGPWPIAVISLWCSDRRELLLSRMGCQHGCGLDGGGSPREAGTDRRTWTTSSRVSQSTRGELRR